MSRNLHIAGNWIARILAGAAVTVAAAVGFEASAERRV